MPPTLVINATWLSRPNAQSAMSLLKTDTLTFPTAPLFRFRGALLAKAKSSRLSAVEAT
jgi:hypothetical protein